MAPPVSPLTVDRPSRAPQVYGYTVCLVAVLTLLISVPQAVEAVFALSDPVRARERDFGPEVSFVSYDAFSATYPRATAVFLSGPDGPPRQETRDSLSDPDMRRRYEALRADHVDRVRFNARLELTKYGLLILLAVGLFVSHWRWLRRREGVLVSAAPGAAGG